MHIPNNAEKLQIISGEFQEKFIDLARAGVSYDDVRVVNAATLLVERYMPELGNMATVRVEVEAGTGISKGGNPSEPFDGVHVTGILSHLSVAEMIEHIKLGDERFPTFSHDLSAVVTPVYVDPEPSDIVFGRALFVPFGSITKFEPVAA